MGKIEIEVRAIDHREALSAVRQMLVDAGSPEQVAREALFARRLHVMALAARAAQWNEAHPAARMSLSPEVERLLMRIAVELTEPAPSPMNGSSAAA